MRQYELQVGGKMTKSGDFSTVDLKKLMDEIETLRTRAEAAESSIGDDNIRVTNGSPHHNNNSELSSPMFDHSVLGLKENILRLDSEKATLENLLLQREKKIELLEEDLRGPVPFEMGRYIYTHTHTHDIVIHTHNIVIYTHTHTRTLTHTHTHSYTACTHDSSE